MKWIVVFLLFALATNSVAAVTKRSSQPGAKANVPVAELKSAWDRDSALVKLLENESYTMYGIENSAKVSDVNKEVISLWVATLYTAEGRKTLDASVKEAYYSKERLSIDCSRNAFTVDTMYFFDAKGRVVYSSKETDDWADIVPGSLADALLQVLCSGEQDTPSAVPASTVPF